MGIKNEFKQNNYNKVCRTNKFILFHNFASTTINPNLQTEI